MTGTQEKLYWRTDKNWYGFDPSTEEFYLTESAPEKAKESFDLWKNESRKYYSSNEQTKEMRKRIRLFSVMHTCR